MRNVLASAFAAMTAVTSAQEPQLSPVAAYEQAVRPVEIVHRSVTNWSDSEAASLAVAIQNGVLACASRKPEDYRGDDLIAYGRLCSLGMQWPQVNAAATRYIESADTSKPQLALAYGMKVEALLNTHEVPEMLATAKAMLAANPYDATVDAAANEALEYMQLAFTEQALELHRSRQPLLLTALASDKPQLPLHSLYADGLAYAALQQYAGKPEEAAATVAALDGALVHAPAGDEAVLIAQQRRRYAMLGQPLPALSYEFSLLDRKPKPRVDPGEGASLALLVFPPWCAQCVRMAATDLRDAVATLKNGAVQLYALLAASMDALDGLNAAKPVTPAALLLHTQTILVPAETVDLLQAPDFPWLVVTDNAGIVRFVGTAPETALKSGQYIDRATDHVAEVWPSRFVPVVPAAAAGAPAVVK